MDTLELSAHLHELELQLLNSSLRRSAFLVGNMLTDDFREFGSSGHIYDKAGVLDALSDEAPTSISASNFHCSRIAPNAALLTYISAKQTGDETFEALRASLWICQENSWRMSFHQGTRVPSPSVQTF